MKRKPQHQLQSSIAQFTQKFDGPGNLLIVYYSGHGVWKDLENFLQLTACTNPMLGKGLHQDAHVNWSKAIDLLISGDVDADVLAILDTSYASNDSKGSSKISDRGTRKFELLTASGLDQTTQAPGPYSFTRSLIDNLKDLVMEYDSAPFSSFHLNQRICMDPRRREVPSHLWYLFPNGGNILLAPKPSQMSVSSRKRRSSLARASNGRLTLTFDLRDEYLNREQIEVLTRSLTKALENKNMLGIRKIDWHGIESTVRTCQRFERIALMMLVVVRFRRVLQRKDGPSYA